MQVCNKWLKSVKKLIHGSGKSVSRKSLSVCVCVCLSVAGSVVESWAKEEKGQSESF